MRCAEGGCQGDDYMYMYREVVPHAYSGPGRTCSPKFAHIRKLKSHLIV